MIPRRKDKFYCDCRKHCHGIPTLRPRTTYYKHKKYRDPPPEFNELPLDLAHGNFGASTSVQNYDYSPGLGDGWPDEDQSESQTRIDIDQPGHSLQMSSQNTRRSNNVGTPLGIEEQNFESGSEMSSHLSQFAEDEQADQPHDCDDDELHSEHDSVAPTFNAPTSDNVDEEHIDPSTAKSLSEFLAINTESIQTFLKTRDPKVPDLKTAIDFIRELERSSLESTSLTSSQIMRLRDPGPPNMFADDSTDLYSLKQFIATMNSSEETYRLVSRNYNERHPETPMLTLEDIKTALPAWSGVYGIRYNMCVNTCMAFTGPFENLENCSFCGAAQYHPKKGRQTRKPLRQFYSMPLGPQIQALWKSRATASRMGYRREETYKLIDQLRKNGGEINVYEDFIHGSEYLCAVESGIIAPEDTLFMFGMDGAQLYRDKASDCWLFMIVLLEMPPQERYLKKHVLAVSCVPGPQKPQQFDSFLFPTFQHIAAVNNDGGLRIWNSQTNENFVSKLFYFLSIADGPASVYFTGLVGHHGAYPCRLFCGIKGRNKPGASCYYPALLKPDDYDVEGCDHEDIDVEKYRSSATQQYDSSLLYLLYSKNKTNYAKRRKETGISKPPLVLGLSSTSRLPISRGLCGEAMHVSTLNLGELLLPLWRGTFACEKTDKITTWDWAILRDTVLWEEHGKAVEMCRPFIPGSFDRAPRNIAQKINTGYKAKEWQNYFLGLAPALLMHLLPRPYWRNLCKLIRAIQICTQHSIRSEDLIHAQHLLDNFVVEFEEIYIQRRIDRMHFARPCLHALWHLGLDVPRLGPSGLYASWVVERTIGNLGQEIRSDSSPFSNLGERCLLRCQINALKAIYPTLIEAQVTPLPWGARDLGRGFILLHPHDRYPSKIEELYQDLFRVHMVSYGIHPPPDGRFRIVRWGRVLLPNGQIARCAWKELQRTTVGRCSRNVKYYGCNELVQFGEIIFFFLTEINGEDRGFALIRNFSPYDPAVYQESFGTVIQVTQQDDFQIIPIHSLLSVIAVNPWNEHQPGSFFIWEKPGIPLSMLCDLNYDEQV